MQGDIMLPRPRRAKPAPKPKPIEHSIEPPADIVLDEAALDIDKADLKKKRRILIAPHKHFQRFWRWWLGQGRNGRFAIIAAILLIFGAGAIGWFYFIQPQPAPRAYSVNSHHKPRPPAPVTVPSPLTGVQVDPSLAKRPVTGIMIENSIDARPQSGLQDAGVVYEAIAEGGVTRFLALFQDTQPQYIGPIRSLRPYYIDFAAPFQASIVHVGGSPDALSEVANGNFRNLDQFANSGYFTRISSRYAPHNVYTSFARIDALNQARGYTSSTFTSWPRKADKKLAVPTAKTIDLSISGPIYYVHYDYDPGTNTYLRSEGGGPHLDLVSSADRAGVQLRPKAVIAVVMPRTNGVLDATGAYYSNYQDSGSGTAYIFQDGNITQGVWSKAGTSEQLSFQDSAGNPIPLDAGQTWITLIQNSGQVSYKP